MPRTAARRVPLRQPRVAEMVADVLRQRIVGGELAEGSELPKQEELLEEFGVSRPSLRESLRILETEGLITVRRGNVGGATVHLAQTSTAAYMLGLVLQSEQVVLADLGASLRFLEPVGGALCAGREDRHEAVVPTLRAINARASEVVDEELELLAVGRRFHEALIELCGNKTIILVVGTLESLWSSHEQAWAQQADVHALPDAGCRRAGHRAHERIVDLIERGEVDEVAKAVRKHVEGAQAFALDGDGKRPINASLLKRPQLR